MLNNFPLDGHALNRPFHVFLLLLLLFFFFSSFSTFDINESEKIRQLRSKESVCVVTDTLLLEGAKFYNRLNGGGRQFSTNPEEHQMARDNNPMSLHLSTRTGYVQIDTMRTMREQRP